MRGARIAEKIQEFYNTTGGPTLSSGNQTLSGGGIAQKAGGVPSRQDLHSQGGTRASKIILVNETAHAQGGPGRQRATSAYGSHNSRRNLNAHL